MLTAEQVRGPGAVPPAAGAGHMAALAVPRPDEVSGTDGVGLRLQAIVLLFLFLLFTIVHIFKESVFKNKHKPEMYIWDSDQATPDVKPQVSCFKLTAPLGDTESLWRVGVQICI